MNNIDWDDSAARSRLIDSVGISEYSRLQREHQERSSVARVNGYRIRPVGTRFGRLFMVDGAGVAFSTLQQAETHAKSLPTGDAQ